MLASTWSPQLRWVGEASVLLADKLD